MMPVVRSSAAELVWQVDDPADVVVLQSAARRFVTHQGLDDQGAWKFVIAVSEAATNMIKYAGVGTVTVTAVTARQPGVRFEALDSGPGFSDVEHALQDHVSEGQQLDVNPMLRRRRGLGTGLGAMRRLLDALVVENRPGGGARVVGTKFRST